MCSTSSICSNEPMDAMLNMREAAEACGINRATVARWVEAGRLKRVKTAQVRNLTATMVDIDELRELAKGITTGRPSKSRARSKRGSK